LKNGNPELIHFLSLKQNEFGEIARLVKRFFEQNQQLRTEMEERRKTEMLLRQAQKMESIGTLAGGIAHDFNNIITIISGYIALAAGKIVNDREAQNNLDEAMRACQRAKSLIEKILTFSRQTDKTVIPVHLARIIKDTVDLLRATIPPSITIETDLRTDSHVLADPTEIQQVVMNIATNSYHAMRYQGGMMSVRLYDMSGNEVHNIVPAAENKSDYVCICIIDTGAGIPQEMLERIFDPYFSTKAAGEGTGLGLSIVHGIVTACGGYIHISSIINGGTTVKIFLPVTFLRWGEISEPSSTMPFTPANIIFVDDEAALSELFRETLSEAGYNVTAFSDSTLALKMFESDPQHFDLMVADIAMPALNGINLSKRILELRPQMPIILYTGFSDATIQKSCKELGINRVLLKPILPESLSQVVAQVLAEL
jgi:signal transduction histidine kinase/CheY-like chemotaxis protein